MADNPAFLAEKIRMARTVDGLQQDQRLVPYRNIGDLLLQQLERYDQKTFLIYYSDDGHRDELSYQEFCEDVARFSFDRTS